MPQIMAQQFNDEYTISSWALDAVRTLQQTGLIGGKPGNIFEPQGMATRAESAAIITNFINIYMATQI
jgi:hypothetical protein